MRCPSHPDKTAASCCTVCGSWHCVECAPLHPSLGAPACPGCRPTLANYQQMSPRTGVSSRAVVAILLGFGLFAGIMITALHEEGPDADSVAEDLALAYRNLEKVGTALELYRLDQGDYPDSLDELLPKYLEELPVDPFDKDSKSLHFRGRAVTGQRRLLYSVGPDHKDQGGQDRDPISGLGDLTYPVD